MKTNQMNRVVKAVSVLTKIDEAEMFEKDRVRHKMDARRLCIAAIKELFGFTLVVIGGHFNMNHSTIIYHLRTHKSLIVTDIMYHDKYIKLVSMINTQIDE